MCCFIAVIVLVFFCSENAAISGDCECVNNTVRFFFILYFDGTADRSEFQ